MPYTQEQINKYNAERLAKVLPSLAEKCRIVIRFAADDGFVLLVSQGLRTFKEQDALFAKRPRVTKARGGQSMHNYGLAVDFAFVVNGTISWDEKLYRRIGGWAKEAGLEWGGNWKFTDLPHVQISNGYDWRDCLAIAQKGGLNELWNRVMTPKIRMNTLAALPAEEFEEDCIEIGKEIHFEPEAEAVTPTKPKEIEGSEPVGMKAKIAKLFAGVTGGTLSLATLKEVFSVQISAETLELLKVVLPTILILAGIAFIVWFIAEKVTNWKVTKLTAEINSDKSRDDIKVVPK
jgi:hypothetical protein